MREIKFRAWDKKLKRMAYDIQNYYDNLGYEYTPSDVYATFDCFLNNEFQEVMQYTGLNDKNGKEIYEGDIKEAGGLGRLVVKFGHYDNGEHYEDHEEGFGWYLQSVLDGRIYGMMYIGLNNNPVIGNIYENKELLNE